MKTVSVTQFKASPSAYFKIVQAGHRILLIGRKKPVAILEPIEPEDDEEAFIEQLVELGIAKPPRRPKTGSKLGAKLAVRTTFG